MISHVPLYLFPVLALLDRLSVNLVHTLSVDGQMIHIRVARLGPAGQPEERGAMEHEEVVFFPPSILFLEK